MKSLHTFLVLICFCAFAKAQNTTPTTEADALVYKLEIGKCQKINGVKVTFLEVLEDSRCPKDVDCVWAGQAKVKVRIKEKGQAPVEKEFIFGGLGKDVLIHTSESAIIKGVRLSPYPKTSVNKDSRVYSLEIRA